MKLIAHRGNLYGPSPYENNPQYIQAAYSKGFDVEIDVWWVDGVYYLGHDDPKYQIRKDFLTGHSEPTDYWCHAKNEDAFKALLDLGANCFWHDSDKYTMTSEGIVWSYPGAKCIPNAIWNQPEWGSPSKIYDVTKADMNEWFGVCSDYVGVLKEIYEDTLLLTKVQNG